MFLWVVTERPSAELGVEMLPPQRWFEVYETVSRIAQMQPDDADLAAAVAIIGERILQGLPQRPESDTGRILSEAIHGDRTRFDVFSNLRWIPFPGGRTFRVPYSVIGSWWYAMRDKLGV